MDETGKKEKRERERSSFTPFQYFTAQVDRQGRLVIPGHIRRRLKIYGEVAEVDVAVLVSAIFVEPIKEGEKRKDE